MTRSTVFVLHHEYERFGRDESKLIGIYATRADAEAAIGRLRSEPGFRAWPDGFTIGEFELGRDHWTEGFAVMVPIHVPVAGHEAGARMECVMAECLQEDRYRIHDVTQVREAMHLAFGHGQVVRCEERTIDGVAGCLVAVEAVDQAVGLQPERPVASVFVQFHDMPDREISLAQLLALGDTFRICAELHRWPPLRTFNAFLGCGIDDCDGDELVWRPFGVDLATYTAARLQRDPQGIVDAFGVSSDDWAGWFAAAVELLRADDEPDEEFEPAGRVHSRQANRSLADIDLHDATLVALTTSWNGNAFVVEIHVRVAAAHKALRLRAKGCSRVVIPHEAPWGPSVSINTHGVDGRRHWLELQSGDTIEVWADEIVAE